MVKVKVKIPFIDKEAKCLRYIGDIIEISEKRYNQIETLVEKIEEEKKNKK